jgi:hypothetical protein
VVLVVTQYDPPQPFADLGGAMMLPTLKLGFDDFELRDHPLCRRNPPDVEGSAAPESSTEVGEPQKCEGLRLTLATPFSVSCGEPPEFDQSRLVRMQFQAEPDEPFPKLLKETLGVGPVLKAHHKIVGIPDDNYVARRLSCAKLPPTDRIRSAGTR